MGGRDLTLRVTHDSAGPHTAGAPQPRQRHHHREQQRLHDIDPLEARRSGLAAQDILGRPVEMGRERLRTGPHRLGEHGRGIEQLQRHALPLRALAGEQEDHTAARRTGGRALDDPRGRPAAGEGVQGAQQGVAIRADHHCTMLQARTRGGQGEADVQWIRGGDLTHVL